jgi:SAM-dependent methyltransferase
MGSFRWINRELHREAQSDDSIVELGAGDGGLLHYVAARQPLLANRWTGLDLAPPPDYGLPPGTSWVQGNFMTDAAPGAVLAGGSVVVANLILHHFEDHALAELGHRLADARLIIASEPARHAVHHWKGRLLDAIFGFNYVTMYDMRCSIQAGFRTGELAGLLGLDPARWHIRENHSQLGACRFVASRRE